MATVVRSRIFGAFLGYAPRVIHRLDDGTEWEQVSPVSEFVYSERPACRITQDEGRYWIEVEGVKGRAEVRQTGHLPYDTSLEGIGIKDIDDIRFADEAS